MTCFAVINCRDAADVVFVIDNSGGVNNPSDYREVLAFVAGVAAVLPIDAGRTRVAAVTFSNTIVIQFALDALHTSADVRRAVLALPYAGYEARAAEAIRTAAARLAASVVRRFVVFVGDGSSANQTATLDAGRAAKDAGVVVLTVSAGTTWVNVRTLTRIASYPYPSDMIVVNDYGLLQSVVTNVSSAICNSKSGRHERCRTVHRMMTDWACKSDDAVKRRYCG